MKTEKEFEQKSFDKIVTCVATDMVASELMPIAYMYREEAEDEDDSGWRFFTGAESLDYVDEPENYAVYELSAMIDHDKSIAPYLEHPVGTELERIEGSDEFVVVED